MLLQVGELAEASFTVGAAVRLEAQVDAQMLGQVRGVRKRLGAVRTLVGFRLCVRFGVNLHVGLGEEGQGTNFTPGNRKTGDMHQEENTEINKSLIKLLIVQIFKLKKWDNNI